MEVWDTSEKYKTLALPEEMIALIEKFIQENPQLGYKTVPEFIKDTLRRRLEQFENFEKKEA